MSKRCYYEVLGVEKRSSEIEADIHTERQVDHQINPDFSNRVATISHLQCHEGRGYMFAEKLNKTKKAGRGHTAWFGNIFMDERVGRVALPTGVIAK